MRRNHDKIFRLFPPFKGKAKYAGMNATLLRQYAAGVKNPSLEQAKKIEKALHILADELREANIVN